MDSNLLLICLLTFIIHLIGTLAYAARIAGVRTRRIALSFSLFNILVLVSRTSNSFQMPFLGKRVERTLNFPGHNLLADFRWMLLSASLATLIGALFIPTFQRIFSRAVLAFQTHRSIPRLMLLAWSQGGITRMRDSISVPVSANITGMRAAHGVSATMIGLNVFSVSLWTVGIFASLYAGYLNPQLRLTSSLLSSIINGGATLLMFVIIDPQVSVMTEDVVEGRLGEPGFRRAIVWLVGSRLAGTMLAQLLLAPAASLIVFVAEKI
jgi:hypothetical protein